MPLNSKKTEISFLNILFCIIVMFVHISSEPMSKLDKSSIQYIFVLIPWRLSAFIVQGYIFLSSLKLFLKNTDKFNYKEFLKNRVKLIFVPYLMWVMVYYLYFCSIDYFDFKLLDYVRYVLNGSIVSPFYFVIIIFQFYILMPLWTNLFKKYKSSVLVVTSLFIMILSKKYFPVIFGDSFKYYDRILTTYIFYWFWGCAVGLNYNSFKNFVTKNIILITFLFLAISTLDAYLSYRAFGQGIYVPLLENIHVIYCILAIMLSLAVFAILSKYGLNLNKPLKYIDASSFYIYLSHCFVINIINKEIIHNFGIYSIGKAYLIRFVLTYIITLTLCTLYSKIKEY